MSHDTPKQILILGGGFGGAYDYLVIALGSITNFFNLPGLPARAAGARAGARGGVNR